MIEIWFGILGDKCLKNGWFGSVEALIQAIDNFALTWNESFRSSVHVDIPGLGSGWEGSSSIHEAAANGELADGHTLFHKNSSCSWEICSGITGYK